MQKITSILNNQQGSVVVIAVIILVLLTIIGIAATNTSTTEMQISTNAVLHNVALYTADSGIEAGRAALNIIKIADAGSWDKLLNNSCEDPECPGGPPDPLEVIVWNGTDCTSLNDILDADGGRTVGPATFTLTISDTDLDGIDVDLDGNNAVDSDDTIFLTSTLVSPYRNATATIRTTVRGGGVAYSQEHYNAGSSGEAAVESETATANLRW
jgi:hypothetical protein